MKNPSHEYELLAELQNILTEHSENYEIEIGDDAAVRKSSDGHKLIFTADLSVENIHFKREWVSMYEIGYKAMITNVSDCASMGAEPESALVQLIIPTGTADVKTSIVDLYRGFNDACKEWHFPIIGGDLSKGAQWSIGITLIGKIPSYARCLTRKGAQAGDKLWVSGFPGKSAAGLDALIKWGRNDTSEIYKELLLAHIRPKARVKLGQILREQPEIHAVMDLSDGLAKDARTLAFENNLGIVLNFDSSLIPKTMISLGEVLQKKPIDWVINGGEEYELLFAASSLFNPSSLQSKEIDGCICIGEFTNACIGLNIRDECGIKEITTGGWDHV